MFPGSAYDGRTFLPMIKAMRRRHARAGWYRRDVNLDNRVEIESGAPSYCGDAVPLPAHSAEGSASAEQVSPGTPVG